LTEINEGYFDYKQEIGEMDVLRNVKYGRQFVIGEQARVGFMVSNKEDVFDNKVNPLIYGKGIEYNLASGDEDLGYWNITKTYTNAEDKEFTYSSWLSEASN